MYISERSQEGGDQNRTNSNKGGWGSKFWFFQDNLIIDSPHQQVLAVFKRKNSAIMFPFSNNFLIIFKNMSLNNIARKMKFSIKDFLSKFDQIRSFLEKSLMENIISRAV